MRIRCGKCKDKRREMKANTIKQKEGSKEPGLESACKSKFETHLKTHLYPEPPEGSKASTERSELKNVKWSMLADRIIINDRLHRDRMQTVRKRSGKNRDGYKSSRASAADARVSCPPDYLPGNDEGWSRRPCRNYLTTRSPATVPLRVTSDFSRRLACSCLV